ncbi:MAG: hypothetical protein J2P49_02965 [Methylocapsa sp.]|nr:hypothetical protein [Methylocapsa sp.]
MDRVMMTFFAMVLAGLMLAAIWAVVSAGTTFEKVEDGVTGWVQKHL